VLPQPRRRWALFPRSVISDFENPSAHLYRAMARQIATLNDEARFYEERANPWLRGMLKNEGSSGFRRFQETHPEVTYVTYEPREGHRLAEWLSLALATVDIVIVDSAITPTLIQWIGELTRPQLHTFLFDPDKRAASLDLEAQRVSWYSGICTVEASAADLSIRNEQHLITFGPTLPGLGSNGNAFTEVDATARSLVEDVVEAVDTELSSNSESHSQSDNES
jgi:hypothetical protein